MKLILFSIIWPVLNLTVATPSIDVWFGGQDIPFVVSEMSELSKKPFILISTVESFGIAIGNGVEGGSQSFILTLSGNSKFTEITEQSLKPALLANSSKYISSLLKWGSMLQFRAFNSWGFARFSQIDFMAAMPLAHQNIIDAIKKNCKQK